MKISEQGIIRASRIRNLKRNFRSYQAGRKEEQLLWERWSIILFTNYFLFATPRWGLGLWKFLANIFDLKNTQGTVKVHGFSPVRGEMEWERSTHFSFSFFSPDFPPTKYLTHQFHISFWAHFSQDEVEFFQCVLLTLAWPFALNIYLWFDTFIVPSPG